MGVTGLWQLIESVGTPVKVEKLEGKRLGVDANIWLYKFIRGFREGENYTNLDAHKLGLFNRICKLLFYKIKPIFVFDGPAPVLKRRTLEKRQNVRNKHLEKVQDAAMRLLADQLKGKYPEMNLSKVMIKLPQLKSNHLVAAEKFTNDDRDLFYLPPKPETQEEEEEKETDSSEEEEEVSYLIKDPTLFDARQFDIESKEFSQLPPEIRYETLQDVKESRRKIRRVDRLPEDAASFSNFQLDRLRLRRNVQQKIEQCELEIQRTYGSDGRGQVYLSNKIERCEPEIQKTHESDGRGQVYLSNKIERCEPEIQKTHESDGRGQVYLSNKIERCEPEIQKTHESEDLSQVYLSNKIEYCDIESKELPELSPETSCDSFQEVEESTRMSSSTEELPEDSTSFSNLESVKSPLPNIVQEEIEQLEEEHTETSQPSVVVTCETLNGVKDAGKEISAEELQPESTIGKASSVNQAIDIADETEKYDKNQQSARKVTSKIIEEAQELLRLFGVPFIVAAGEAEAQCAVLEKLKLTEGTITDDSDIWLFGARNVYRHFFNDKKNQAQQYRMADIEAYAGLSREKMVCLAMLVGSDYTDGVMNVGPVTAMKILNEFQGQDLDPLIRFKQWREEYTTAKDKKVGNEVRKGFLKYLLPDSFPSRTVFDAYLHPTADLSTEKFVWGIPDLDELREYVRRNFGWSSQKADDTLLPVVKRVNDSRRQLCLR